MTDAQVVGWVFLIVGAAVLAGAGSLYVMALGSARWASTEGRIVSAEWVRSSSTDSTTALSYRYRHEVTYEYAVGGSALTGKRPWFGHSMWGWRWAPRPEQRPTLYRVGQPVTVYYDPAHPERCTLSRTVPGDRFRLLLAVAGLFVLAGLGAMTGHVAVR